MKVDKLIPEIYFKESRDFSYIGRIFEVILDYMKTNSDLVSISAYNDRVNADVIDLISRTLGFEGKHKYITKNLIYIISAFTELLRKKGSLDAVEEAVRILCNSQNITYDYSIDYVLNDKHDYVYDEINIRVPSTLKDVILLEDILEYILPTGVLYNIILTNEINNPTVYKSKIYMKNKIDPEPGYFKDYELGQVYNGGNNSEKDIDSKNRSSFYTGKIVTKRPEAKEVEGE